jgi:alpha-L-fucosidase
MVVHEMIEVVSRNGNFLINVGPMADGTIPPGQVRRLKAMGEWLKINGESIYGTRYWSESEQKEDHLAFTTKGKLLYAIKLEEPSQPFAINNTKGWQEGSVRGVRLVGSKAVVDWTLTEEGLRVVPPTDLGESMFAWAYEIVTDRDQHTPTGVWSTNSPFRREQEQR